MGVAIALALASLPARAEPAPTIEFSDGFLIGGKAIDMQRYMHRTLLEPGVHRLDVMLNGQWLQTADVVVEAGQPCVPMSLVRRLGLKAAYLDLLDADPEACAALVERVEGTSVEIDSAALQLRIGIPQAAQAAAARGDVAPAQRDHGIVAGFVDYSFNQHRSKGRDNRYLGLRAGVNLGAWRLRHRAWISQGEHGMQHAVLGSELQRDLPAWDSQLFIGQGTTGGELFESLSFTGVRVATDERMLPDSLRGYAPVVRGMAEGNAVVRVRQSGHVIHEISVAPGPFAIEDLYPTSFGGDLDVTVTEADGREQRFRVGFSAVPQALRAGSSRFSATTGALRDDSGRMETRRFVEGTYARGLGNRLTVLGGAQVGEQYRAELVGAALNTRIGAFGADMMRSRAYRHASQDIGGSSFRLNYQRYLARTATHVGLAAYRYSTRGFLTLNDAARLGDGDQAYGGRARQRYQVNVSQQVGQRSTLYFSGGHVAYWDRSQRQSDFQFGFHSILGRANYGVSAMRYRLGGDAGEDTRYTFTFSMPLGRSTRAPRINTRLSSARKGQQAELRLTGALGEASAANYSLSASDAGRDGNSYNAYAAYRSSRGALDAGYSHTPRYRTLTLGAAGSVALHAGGINAGPTLGDGFALVQAQGAEGARVGNGGQIRVARNGYALLPHVSPYRWNQIDVDPSGLPLDVELLQTSQRVAPTAGSIVRVAFNARHERTLFIDGTDALGHALPFAARVEDEAGRVRGAVGQGGVIQLRGAQDAGALIVDPHGPRRCRLEYAMPEAPDRHGLSWSRALCTPLEMQIKPAPRVLSPSPNVAAPAVLPTTPPEPHPKEPA